MSTWSELSEHAKTHRKEAVKRFRKNRKRELLEYAGGVKCTSCGYDKPILEVYEFHHVDPTQKDPSWSKMLANGHKLETLQKEIDKCIVLCANCHREVHAEERGNIPR